MTQSGKNAAIYVLAIITTLFFGMALGSLLCGGCAAAMTKPVVSNPSAPTAQAQGAAVATGPVIVALEAAITRVETTMGDIATRIESHKVVSNEAWPLVAAGGMPYAGIVILGWLILRTRYLRDKPLWEKQMQARCVTNGTYNPPTRSDNNASQPLG